MLVIILGLLMIQKCTLYEMRKTIEANFTNISSNSTGSIQATLKKLLNDNMISFSEYVENSVNKKVYEITDVGKAYFFDIISKPMLYKEKNMELSKFMFMGFLEKDKWLPLIEAYIAELNKELNGLDQIKSEHEPQQDFDDDYVRSLQENGAVDIVADKVKDIALFQYATLDLSIAKLTFEKQWFEAFKQNLL